MITIAARCSRSHLTFSENHQKSIKKVIVVNSFRGTVSISALVAQIDMSRKEIVFVTGNAKKLEEVVQMFINFYKGTVPFAISSKNVDLPEHQGEQDDICKMKARAAYDIIKGPCIVEDTSLCFNALGGLPGPYVKWFLQKTGPEGLHRMLHGFQDKSAMAVCTVAYVNELGEIELFKGETEGSIVEPKTEETFGWDSCFQPEGYNVTFAEMPKSEKNRISHRKKAMFQLMEFLDKNIIK
ncbi:inosine triphosphate pyrophosphatase isoform X3 [Adelges cooleyi]|uniref:inosine triphosphate pyrophosphatase isoform X3 n=1 Tax=Adelges cooleyi TaxID=133065 RepID=UPI00217F23FA|nr:inosine triphosphate pyrophosphatase isoform X3 [Adelges cooleyi]